MTVDTDRTIDQDQADSGQEYRDRSIIMQYIETLIQWGDALIAKEQNGLISAGTSHLQYRSQDPGRISRINTLTR